MYVQILDWCHGCWCQVVRYSGITTGVAKQEVCDVSLTSQFFFQRGWGDSCCSTRDRSVTVVCPSMSMDSTSLSWVWIYPHSSRLGYVFGSGLKNTSSQLRSRYFVVTPPSTNFRLYSTQMFGGKDENPTLREYRERLIPTAVLPLKNPQIEDMFCKKISEDTTPYCFWISLGSPSGVSHTHIPQIHSNFSLQRSKNARSQKSNSHVLMHPSSTIVIFMYVFLQDKNIQSNRFSQPEAP